MKVYRVKVDVERYQWLIPDDEALWAAGVLTFDCQRKIAEWPRPVACVENPKLVSGDFYNFAPGTLVVRPSGLNVVRDQFERAGELLPLRVEGQSSDFVVLNVLECVNCLDAGATEFETSFRTGEPIGVQRYEFNPRRIDESTLFKIPKTSRSEVLTVEGIKDPEDEFKHIVETSGLTGLRFELLWESID